MGFWSAVVARCFAGVGWAGTYMTGLKLLADRVDGKLMSRATAGHAASVGISGSISIITADLIAGLGGWHLAFLVGAAGSATAWALVAFAVPGSKGNSRTPTADSALFDF